MLLSASGSRIDCDECGHHAAAASLSVEDLRRTTGYVYHRGRDFCPACWYEHTTWRFGSSSGAPTDGGSSAA